MVAKKLRRISGVIDEAGPPVEADQAAKVGGVGSTSMHRSVGVGQVGEEVSDQGLEGVFLR